jgi:tetratricopeptide (TPR) repeat protein
MLDRTLDEARQRPPIPGRAAQAKAMIAAARQDADLAKALVHAGGRASLNLALRPDTHLLLAALADHYNEVTEAEYFFRKALKDVTSENELLVYGGFLRLLWKNNKTDEIIQLCREGTTRVQAANQVLLYSDLAKALARNGKLPESLEAADRALALANPEDRLALRCLRVRLLIFAERYDRAEAECLGLLKLHGQPGEILEIRYLLSSVYSTARNVPKAEEQLELVLKIDPNNATVCNDLGYIWADQNKNLAHAEELIRKAMDLDRQQRKGPPGPGTERVNDNAAYVDSLGWVLYRRGQADAARKELERATALPDGNDPAIWDHLGDVYQHLHMDAQARSAWQRARALYEQEGRRKMDERYREVLRKLQATQGAASQR